LFKALYGKPISELWSVICHIGSHSITCHLTQVNASCLKLTERPVIDLPTPEGWQAKLTLALVIYWYALPVHRP